MTSFFTYCKQEPFKPAILCIISNIPMLPNLSWGSSSIHVNNQITKEKPKISRKVFFFFLVLFCFVLGFVVVVVLCFFVCFVLWFMGTRYGEGEYIYLCTQTHKIRKVLRKTIGKNFAECRKHLTTEPVIFSYTEPTIF